MVFQNLLDPKKGWEFAGVWKQEGQTHRFQRMEKMEAYHKKGTLNIKKEQEKMGFYDEENDHMEKNLPLESWESNE